MTTIQNIIDYFHAIRWNKDCDAVTLTGKEALDKKTYYLSFGDAVIELKRIEKENAELRAKLFKAETERGVMFEEYDKVRAKLDAWEKQSPVAHAYIVQDMEGEYCEGIEWGTQYTLPDDNSLVLLFTKPKEA